jgi:hypothetical protein
VGLRARCSAPPRSPSMGAFAYSRACGGELSEPAGGRGRDRIGKPWRRRGCAVYIQASNRPGSRTIEAGSYSRSPDAVQRLTTWSG